MAFICQRDVCTLMFFLTLFSSAKVSNQSKCPPMDGNMYIQSRILSSDKKKRNSVYGQCEWNNISLYIK
jgi:hypothetical protein